MATINRNLPTGFTTVDIILGENERDLSGNLINVVRGVPIGDHGVIAASQGAGKTTLIAQSTSFPIKAGYPCHKVIIFDTDGNVYKKSRLMNLTKMTEEEVDKYYTVYNVNQIEEIVKYLDKEHKEYVAQKYKMVKFFDPIRQEEVKMMPYVQIVIDTCTSINSALYDTEGKSGILSNESSLTTNRFIANLVNTGTNFFDNNVSFIWAAHLKDRFCPCKNSLIDGKSLKVMQLSI